MEIKCYKCETLKDISCFYKNKRKKHGVNTLCKDCQKEYMEVYREENKDRIKEVIKDYKEKNKDVLKEKAKVYQKENKDKLYKYQKEYREKNRERLNEQNKKYRNETSESRREYKRNWQRNNRKKKPWYYAHRDILTRTIKNLLMEKKGNTEEELGYSCLELKEHIESLFIEGMSWDNYGEWHIDHIKPLSKFNNNDDIKVINGLENLQPLWAKDNLSKYNK